VLRLIASEIGPRGSRPAQRYRVNPALWSTAKPPAETAQT
jgi:hypothetical protein